MVVPGKLTRPGLVGELGILWDAYFSSDQHSFRDSGVAPHQEGPARNARGFWSRLPYHLGVPDILFPVNILPTEI